MSINNKSLHKRNKFTPEEDKKLIELVKEYGTDNWYLISKKLPGRKSRQCRDRWTFYLDPNIKKDEWTKEEDMLLLQKQEELGPCWRKIASFFNKRTEISIKNRWNKLERKNKHEVSYNDSNMMFNLKLNIDDDLFDFPFDNSQKEFEEFDFPSYL